MAASISKALLPNISTPKIATNVDAELIEPVTTDDNRDASPPNPMVWNKTGA